MLMQPFALFDTTDAWVFDLDNTLYPESCGLFAQVSQRMTGYIAEYFSISREVAFERQRSLFIRYGTTLRGLMVEHGLEPEPFLDHVHRVDFQLVQPNPELGLKLGLLPGRKLIFTNSPRRHAEQVMARLGITELIEHVFDISDADFIPKPRRECYATLVDRHGVDPTTACMVDDIAFNLPPAKALGMTTVWVSGEDDWARSDPEPAILKDVDFVAESLVRWLDDVLRYLGKSPAAA
jgi:putative hydrolase of the HAD superfamily